MLHLAAGILDLQHKFHPETTESENDQDIVPGETSLSQNQGQPLISNPVDNIIMESLHKPPGVETDRKETQSEEVSFSSPEKNEDRGKLILEGKVQKLMQAMDVSGLNNLERSRADSRPQSHPQGVPFLCHESPDCISQREENPSVEKDLRSYSPDSLSLEDSPTEVREELLFEEHRPTRGPRSSQVSHHESLMTDSGIYEHELAELDSSSDFSESKEDNVVETGSKANDTLEGISMHEQAEGHEVLHADSHGALGNLSESEINPKDVAVSSLTEIKDDFKSSHKRPNTVDLSWYDSVSSDFFIHSALEGNVSHIAEFEPAKQTHHFLDPNTIRRENESCKTQSRKKMVMFIEMPKRRQNSDTSFDTDEDELAAYIYDPQINDSYNTCFMKSREFLEDPYVELHKKIEEDRRNSSAGIDDPLEDPNFAMPSSLSPLFIPSEYDDEEEDEFFMQALPPFGDVTSKSNSAINYKFEMHDTTWGVSSGEVYFDRLTGQRILSTIYEFEVSSDEDTDSYCRMTDSRASHREEDSKSFRKDSLEERSDLFSLAESDEDGISQPDLEGGELLSLMENESEKNTHHAHSQKDESESTDTSKTPCDSDDSRMSCESGSDISHIIHSQPLSTITEGTMESEESHTVLVEGKLQIDNTEEEEDNISKQDNNRRKIDSTVQMNENDSDSRNADVCNEIAGNSDKLASTSDFSEGGGNDGEGQTSNIPEVVVCSEDETPPDIVVTTTDDDNDSEEEFFTSDTYIASRDYITCNGNEICVSNSSCFCSSDISGRNLEVTNYTCHSHLSDDEAFHSDAETDVTFISHIEHHDIANIAEAGFSDSDHHADDDDDGDDDDGDDDDDDDDIKISTNEKSLREEGATGTSTYHGKNMSNCCMAEHSHCESDHKLSSFESASDVVDSSKKSDANENNMKENAQVDNMSAMKNSEYGISDISCVSKVSNLENKCDSRDKATHVLGVNENNISSEYTKDEFRNDLRDGRSSEPLDTKCIDIEALTGSESDALVASITDVTVSNTSNSDADVESSENSDKDNCKSLVEKNQQIDAGNRTHTENEIPRESKITPESLKGREENYISESTDMEMEAFMMKSSFADELSHPIALEKTQQSIPDGGISKSAILTENYNEYILKDNAHSDSIMMKEKQPVTNVIDCTDEIADDLHVPSMGVTRVICVCCESLIVQKSILGESNLNCLHSKQVDDKDFDFEFDILTKETVKERTAPFISKECERIDVNIGGRFEKEANRNKPSSEEPCLTGEEFEICVPDSTPTKPQRLYQRKFPNESTVSINNHQLSLIENKDVICNTDFVQPPIKPKRRKKSPQSLLTPPRKMQKIPETHNMQDNDVSMVSLSADENLKEIQEHCTREGNDDGDEDYDEHDGRSIVDNSGSSSLNAAKTDGEIEGKRVGTELEHPDLNNQQSKLNNNSFYAKEEMPSHDERKDLPPDDVSKIVASIVMESHQKSLTRSHKTKSSVIHNESACVMNDGREGSAYDNDVCEKPRRPSWEDTCDLGAIQGKSLVDGIENKEGECQAADVSYNPLKANSFVVDSDAIEKEIHKENVNREDGYEVEVPPCPCPPKRKKKSPPVLDNQKHQQVLLDRTNLSPGEKINDDRTPPKVPPRTYRRCQSLPRRPKSSLRPGSSPSSDNSLGIRKGVGRSASTATCRPHTSNDPASAINVDTLFSAHKSHRAPVKLREKPADISPHPSNTPNRPTPNRQLSNTYFDKQSRRHSYDGLFGKKISNSFKRTGSLTNKYFSIPRSITKKFNSNIGDSATTNCFPNLFHRKQKQYDFERNYPPKTSEVPYPEPFVRVPSTGSLESFSDLFGFYSAMEHDLPTSHIISPFEDKVTSSNNKRISEGGVDEKPPQAPPRRQKKDMQLVDKNQNTFVKTKLDNSTPLFMKSSDCEPVMEQDFNESSVHSLVSSDETTPVCLTNIEEKETNSLEEKGVAKQNSDPCTESIAPCEVLQNEINKPIADKILDDSGIEISKDDFDSSHILPSSLKSQEEKGEENEQAIHNETVYEKDEPTPTYHPLTNERVSEIESEEAKKETSLNKELESFTTPTESSMTDALSLEVSRQRSPWKPPEVALRTWAQRQGVQELQFMPLSLRCQSLEKNKRGYGSLKELGRKSHQSIAEVDWKRPASFRERDLIGSHSLEDVGYSKSDATTTSDQDTPSPGPPVESEKEEGHQQGHKSQKREDDSRVQQDRCIEVYPETVRQRQRNMMTSSNKVDIKNWNSTGNNNDTLTSPSKVKKFLPSVKALRNQFETGKTNNRTETNGNNVSSGTLSRKSSNSSLASSSLEKTSSTNSLNSANSFVENVLGSDIENSGPVDPDEPVEPIFSQFKKVDEELRELMSKPPSTTGWNPRPLLKRLYYVPEAPKHHSQGTTYINIEGYLEKLPSGRKKATFWNAWKRRYFVAKDGVLYYYQNPQTDKPSMKMTLMGGKVECMEPSMVGVDDGKGHYVVVRCSSKQEAERWRRALETHTVEDFASQYVQPWPIPTNPALLRDTLVIDLGSSSVRAGVLASQATLPQIFLPSVVATERESRRQIWGFDALAPDVRSVSSISFPVRPSHKISKYSVDLSAVSSLLQKAFADLKVDPKNYNVQLSVPRILNPNTQTELLRLLFDKYGVKSVNLTHQSILALYAYNATSGIVVDIGERMDIVPVIDGYIVDGGVSRVPYGGYRILDHLRQFLYMRNISLINEVESYIIRHVLENICYCAHHYNTEKARCTNNPDNYEKGVSLVEYFQKDCPYEFISLDFGRFQATEGLFNPDAWGLDHPGLHKLVHKAIMECSMDIRKEMSRSIFLAGGVTQLPGLVDRLTTEIDNLTPPAIRPKVHASPYRYHAAYIGACVLAESPAFKQSRITQEDWNKHGSAALRKWSL